MKIQFYDGEKIIRYIPKNDSIINLNSIQLSSEHELAVLYVKGLSEYKKDIYDDSFGKMIDETNEYKITREKITIVNIDKLTGVDTFNDVMSMLTDALKVTNFKNLKKPAISYIKEEVRKPLQKLGDLNKDDKYRWSNKEIFRQKGLIDELRKAYFGGGFYVNNDEKCKVHGKSHVLDIKSDYPFIMLTKKFPVGKWYKLNDLSRINFDTDKVAQLFKVRVTNLQSTSDYRMLSRRILMEENRVDYVKHPLFDSNSRLVRCDEMILNLTDVDYKLFVKTYQATKIEIIEAYYAKTDYLPKYFRDFILSNFTAKETLPKGSPEQVKAKRILNAIYGNCLYRGSDEEHYPYSYAWGVWTASYARELQVSLKETFDGCYYSAVDSIFTDNLNENLVKDFNDSVKKKSEELGIEPVNGKFMGMIEIEDANDVVVKGTNNYIKNGETFVSGLQKRNITVEDYLNNNYGSNYNSVERILKR